MCKWEVGENKVDEDFIYFLGEVCSCFSSLVIKSVVTYISVFFLFFFLVDYFSEKYCEREKCIKGSKVLCK